MKKAAAVYTIVKNESYHLKKWINHYKKYFNVEDIYILDHDSDDGSTKNLDVNVIKITNKFVFDHRWMNAMVTEHQIKFLEDYECVLFSEVDELIYSVNVSLDKRIESFLKDNSHNYLKCKSYNLYQNFIEEEKDLTEDDLILDYRNYWSRDVDYDKILLTKVPITWTLGFHHLSFGEPVEMAEDLFLLHTHYFDLDLTIKRHYDRIKDYLVCDDQSGVQNKILDKEGVKKLIDKNQGNSEKIPKKHKEALKGL
jgi:hypothetical protein